MKRTFLACQILAGLWLSLLADSTLACPRLAREIDAIVQQRQFRRARFGVLAQTQSAQPRTLYSHNADQLLITASNVKILTTAAALKALPLDFTVKTELYDLGNGNFHLVGQGDPTLQDKHLLQLAQSLKSQGIQKITRLTLDDRYYGNDAINPDWAWEDIQADYGAPTTGLILNENAIGLMISPTILGKALDIKWQEPENSKLYRIDNLTKTVAIDQSEYINIDQPEPGLVRVTGQLRIGADAEPMGIAVQQPIKYFSDRLRKAFQMAGVEIEMIDPPKSPLLRGTSEPVNAISGVFNQTSQTFRSPLTKGARGIGLIISPALPDWVYEINQSSNNLYAEALLKQLGRSDGQPMGNGYTTDRGLTVLRQQLTKMGIDPNSYQLVDGSGLARKNWVSPMALVQALQAMANNETFRKSLPIAGEGKGLKRRFQNTPAQGIVSAKTGYLTGFIGLSGYAQPKDFEPIVFSIILNHSTEPLDQQIKALDSIAIQLASLNKCEL